MNQVKHHLYKISTIKTNTLNTSQISNIVRMDPILTKPISEISRPKKNKMHVTM